MPSRPVIALLAVVVAVALFADTGPAAEPPRPLSPRECDEATEERIPGVCWQQGPDSDRSEAPGGPVRDAQVVSGEARIDVKESGALRFQGRVVAPDTLVTALARFADGDRDESDRKSVV